jgi:hypothetical protein
LKQEAKLEEEAKEAEEEAAMLPKPKFCIKCDDDEAEDNPKKKKKRPKYRAPEYIIVLDDLSAELKSRSLVALLKMNRHFKAKIIISSQYLNDLVPESIKQLDVFCLFKSFTDDKLFEIWQKTDLSIEFSVFEKLYKDATKEKYSFLYVDTRHDEYRKQFNIKYDLGSI